MIRGGHYPARASSIMRDEPDTADGRAVGAWRAAARPSEGSSKERRLFARPG